MVVCAETLQEEKSIKEALCGWSWNRKGVSEGRKQEKGAEEEVSGKKGEEIEIRKKEEPEKEELMRWLSRREAGIQRWFYTHITHC